MYQNNKIAVIIPALNEEENIRDVIINLPDFVDYIIVADNGSSDMTADIARANNAIIVFEPEKGYGSACLKAIEYLKDVKPDIVVFTSGDRSDDPALMESLIKPLINGHELSIGVRKKELVEKNAMSFTQRWGNWLAVRLIYLVWRKKFSDLGPYRAIMWESLLSLNMCDKDFGWTIEMQIKAARLKMKYIEVPVSYKKRIAGKPKIAGTISGTLKASHKILWWIFKEALNDLRLFVYLSEKVALFSTKQGKLLEKTK